MAAKGILPSGAAFGTDSGQKSEKSEGRSQNREGKKQKEEGKRKNEAGSSAAKLHRSTADG